MRGKASTLLRNLFFLSLAALLTACSSQGGGFGSFKILDTGGAGNYTCDSVKDSGGSTSDFCATGEHPHLCECE